MTVTAEHVTTAPALASLTDDELAAAWQAADVDNPAIFAEFTAEFDRRDRADRTAKMQAGRDAILAEGYDAAFAQHLEASAWCRGSLLSDLGKKHVTDEMSLWTGSKETAWRYASEELQDFWMFVQPRISPGGYARQRGEHIRIQREQALEEREGAITDEHDGHDGQGLAGDAPRALRREPDPVPDAAAAPGGSGPVRPGGGSGNGEAVPPAGPPDGGAGGPVQPGGLGGEPAAGEPVSGAAILNGSVRFSKSLVHMADEMHDAAALAAMVTHTPDSYTTLPRLAAISYEPLSGKSTLVNYFTMVVNNPWDPDPTSYALRAKFTERERPTPIFEEIHEYYGRGGGRSGNKDLNKILKQGYQKSASLSRSVNGVSEDVSCFCVAILAGLRNAVPDEIYTRCIVWKMQRVGAGVRLRDSLDDDVQALGAIHGMRMHQWAKNNAGEVKQAFRNLRRVHPMLFSRLKQIWGPLFAVAQVAGEDWPERCLRAFKVMALDASDLPVLSPEQMVLRDAAGYFRETGEAKAFAAGIREHMTGLDEPLYEKLSERGMALLMTDALGSAQSMTIGTGRAKGYHAGPVLAAWRRLEAQLDAPGDDEPEEDEFDSMFSVTDVTLVPDFEGTAP